MCLSNLSTSTSFLYVDLVSLKSIFKQLYYFKLFLTCLICLISAILGTDSLNSANVPLSNKQNKLCFALEPHAARQQYGLNEFTPILFDKKTFLFHFVWSPLDYFDFQLNFHWTASLFRSICYHIFDYCVKHYQPLRSCALVIVLQDVNMFMSCMAICDAMFTNVFIQETLLKLLQLTFTDDKTRSKLQFLCVVGLLENGVHK